MMERIAATDLATAIRAGGVSAEAAVTQCLARIALTGSKVHAFTGVWPDEARAAAREIDQRRAAGEALPPLAGVPFAVKDLFDVAGHVTLAGSKINRDNPPAAEDAFLVAQMKRAGAICVGATNMGEYAYDFVTENQHYGATHNPHRAGHTAGGSSGGSAAAVAAGLVPLALGSDTNGSIRVPASYCGVYGLRPTQGGLSRRGAFPFVASLDNVGPFAATLADLSLAFDALQGRDPADPHQRSPKPGGRVSMIRAARLTGFFQDNATDEVNARVEKFCAAMKVTATAEWPHADAARAAAFMISAAEGGALHLERLQKRAADFEPDRAHRLMAGALQPAAWVQQAHRFRARFREWVREAFRHADVFIAPATPWTAPAHGTATLKLNGRDVPAAASGGILTQPVSFIGLPVIAAPLPRGEGEMPIGVQLIAAPWREDLLFAFANQAVREGALA